jgi:hypothetical protein
MPIDDVGGVLEILREVREKIERATSILEQKWPETELPNIPDNAGASVVYGRDGYSDAQDPRDPNCRDYRVEDGKVLGVNLLVHSSPLKRYCVKHVGLVDEVVAQGQTVIRAAVIDRAGQPMNAEVRLAYPYDGEASHFANYITAGNEKNEFVMVNKYWPPGLGPLALMILDDENIIISDVVGSLGLPEGHHVSVSVTFQERG